MSVYYTHDNGGRPFKINVDNKNNIVNVYLKIPDEFENKYSNKSSLSIKYKKIFIGKSPLNKMTKFSGGIGDIGNSILLDIGKKTYIFIGEKVIKFTYDKPIIEFVSPVGNSDVPYPYAYDIDGNIIYIPLMVKYSYVKYDKKMFDSPIEFINFKTYININIKTYKKFKLYDKDNNLIRFKIYGKKFYVNNNIVSQSEYLNNINKLLPKSTKIKYTTLIKRN